MNRNNRVLLHISLTKGVGQHIYLKLIKKLYDDFLFNTKNSSSDYLEFDLSLIYDLSASQLVFEFGFTKLQAKNLSDGMKNIDILNYELSLIEKYHINMLTLLDEDYPRELKEIHFPPLVLYTKGEPLVNYDKKLAVVGARKYTKYSQRVLDTILPFIVQNNISIVSGGAFGVDTISHKIAVQNNSKTIVVLGSGLLRPYPKENINFFKKISNGSGTLVSPFPMYMEPEKFNFPARNRVIAGLSSACLVVEAAEKSGSLITADIALNEGRNVFAIPGDILSEMSMGCNNLIKQGAKLISCADDILEEFGVEIKRDAKNKKVKKNEKIDKKKLLSGVVSQKNFVKEPTKEESPILTVITRPMSIDDLSFKLKIDITLLQDKLFDLELEGKVRQNFAGYWEKL